MYHSWHVDGRTAAAPSLASTLLPDKFILAYFSFPIIFLSPLWVKGVHMQFPFPCFFRLEYQWILQIQYFRVASGYLTHQ